MFWIKNFSGFQEHDLSKVKSPAFSFGRRLPSQRSNGSPGPSYMIPARMTRNGGDGTPAYSLHGRTSMRQSFVTPGPGNYREYPIISGPLIGNLDYRWRFPDPRQAGGSFKLHIMFMLKHTLIWLSVRSIIIWISSEPHTLLIIG